MKLIHPHGRQEIDVDPAHAARYVDQGWREVAPDAPKGNASLAAWRKYARSKGFTAADIKGKSRDDLRAALA